MSLPCADPSDWCRARVRAGAFCVGLSNRGQAAGQAGRRWRRLAVSENGVEEAENDCVRGCRTGAANASPVGSSVQRRRGHGTRQGRSVTSRCVAPASLTVTAVGSAADDRSRRRLESGRVDHERGNGDGRFQRGSVQPSVEVEHRVDASIGEAHLERDRAGDGVTADCDLVGVDGSGERRRFSGRLRSRAPRRSGPSLRPGWAVSGGKRVLVFGAERRVDGHDDVAIAREVLRERGRQRHR